MLIFRDLPSSLWMSILSLLILIVGGFVIAFCDKIGKYMQPSNSSAESEPLLDTSMNHVDEVDSISKVFRGVSLSIIVGLTGGSILVPLHYVSESKQGILFLPSFGIGSLLTSPIIYCIHSIFSRSMPALHFRESIWTGLLSGFLYNLGNFFFHISHSCNWIQCCISHFAMCYLSKWRLGYIRFHHAIYSCLKIGGEGGRGEERRVV